MGVSKKPKHPTKKTKLFGLTHSTPNPTTLAVGCGSQPSKPEFCRSNGGFSPLKPKPPDPTDHHIKSTLLCSEPALFFSNSLRFGDLWLR